jgi:hypothetical protein
LQVLLRKTARGSIELEIGRTPAGVLREEETEKQGIASGIALGSPCFSGGFLCGKSQNTAPLAAVMNGKQGFGGATPMMLFPLKDTPLHYRD